MGVDEYTTQREAVESIWVNYYELIKHLENDVQNPELNFLEKP